MDPMEAYEAPRIDERIQLESPLIGILISGKPT